MEHQSILVVDFGGQYNQLIARRVRECNVYAEVVSYTDAMKKINEMKPNGIIFTGGPNSVYDPESPHCEPEMFELGIPVMGICYGSQLIRQDYRICKAGFGPYGRRKRRNCMLDESH